MHPLHALHQRHAQGLADRKETGLSILVGAKAPILDGAQMGSLLVPFMNVEPPYTEIKELIEKIWDWWMEEGKNRERLGEMIKRKGSRNCWKSPDWSRFLKWLRNPGPTPISSGKRKKYRAALPGTSMNIASII